MNYATIKYYDIANGPGVRTSIFVSGCRHHCPGCFNEVAWDFGYGQPFDKAVRNEIFASCQPDYIAGISLLGGEPFEPENQRELLPFVRNFRALYPNKSVWCYSGYTWEQLTGKEPSLARCEATDELLSLLREPAPTHDPDPEVRRETYREALKSGSLHELIAMVRDIYTERTLRRAKGKQLSAYEDSALRNAQNALHSEFAYVMGIRPDEVPAFIEKELNKA